MVQFLAMTSVPSFRQNEGSLSAGRLKEQRMFIGQDQPRRHCQKKEEKKPP
uniref:Uncharacterized protein n=1 Tax=Enterobacter cloacae subsp. cloacae TaxID=336306 RepID=A0A1Z1EA62_ENTCL|nr:hypothetical protein MN001 [Enterobacter cloacae subsp. cloacae]